MRRLFVVLLLFIFHGVGIAQAWLFTNEYPDSSTPFLAITSFEISQSPARGLENYLDYLPGVVLQDGLLHIRGGAAFENSFLLNGFNVTDPFSGLGVYIIPEAIRYIRLKAGNFSAAENALGTSVIATALKSGGPDFNLHFNVQTDKFAPEGETFLGTYSYREHIFTGLLSGSLFKKARYFLAIENQEIGDTQKRFSYGFQFNDLVDLNFYNPDVLKGHPDTVDVTYPDGFTPGNSSKRWALNSLVTLDFSPLKIEITGLYDWYKFYFTNTPMFSVLNERDFYTIQKTAFLGTRFALSFKTVQLNGKLGYYSQNSEKFDKYLSNDWQKWADSAAVVEASGGTAQFRDAWHVQYDYLLAGFPFKRPGSYEDYSKSQHDWLESGMDLAVKIRQNQKVAVGFNRRSFVLRQFTIDPFIMREASFFGTPADVPFRIYKDYCGNNYGYDLNGQQTEQGLMAPRKPNFTDVYGMYQLTHRNLEFKLGLRYQRINTDILVLKDPANPDIDSQEGKVKDEAWKTQNAMSSWNPRFQFTYFLNSNTTMVLNYGYYTLAPFLELGYANPNQPILINGEGNYSVPIFAPEELIQFSAFELGAIKHFSSFGLIRANFYLKNRQKLDEATRNYLEGQSLLRSNFITASDIKGLDFYFSYDQFRRFRPLFQYSYLNAKSDKNHVPYQHQHQILLQLTYRFSESEGGPLLKNSGLNLFWRLRSGHPYLRLQERTPTSRVSPVYGRLAYFSDPGAARYFYSTEANTPWTSTVDLRLDKTIYWSKQLKLTLFVRVNNLFNTKNVINVYPNTGSAEDDGYITKEEYYQHYVQNYGPQYLDLYRAINIKNGQAYWELLGKQLYGHPRQIFLGLQFTY